MPRMIHVHVTQRVQSLLFFVQHDWVGILFFVKQIIAFQSSLTLTGCTWLLEIRFRMCERTDTGKSMCRCWHVGVLRDGLNISVIF
jgi:hypothetical protein